MFPSDYLQQLVANRNRSTNPEDEVQVVTMLTYIRLSYRTWRKTLHQMMQDLYLRQVAIKFKICTGYVGFIPVTIAHSASQLLCTHACL